MSEYLHEVRTKEKIVYLNEKGRDYIVSDNEVRKTKFLDHTLLANEAFIYFDCPQTWVREYSFETVKEPEYAFAIKIDGKNPVVKQRLKTDAVFTRNGYVHLVEIDNKNLMKDNYKKIEKYKKMWGDIENKLKMKPVLYFITHGETRKRKLLTAAKGINVEVMTFEEIR